MPFPSNPTTNQTYTTPSGSAYIYKNGSWTVASGSSGGGSSGGTAASTNLTVVPVASSLSLVAGHSGNIIECADGANLDVPAGLAAGFNININLPPTGSITVTPASGVTINGLTTTITRSSTNSVLALLPTSVTDVYKLTGV